MRPSPVDSATHPHVSTEALRLFGELGYEATSVDAIAAAVGISRSTFFRQYRSKDDAVFVEHDEMLASLTDDLAAASGDDPWLDVCLAARRVFEHFTGDASSRQRYDVISAVPALRDRELVTVFRYQVLFARHLEGSRAHPDRLRCEQFAAEVVATNNFLMRAELRADLPEAAGAENVGRGLERHDREMAGIRARFGVIPRTEAPAVAVAVFRDDSSDDEILRAIRKAREGA